jgi:hypothetical protein
MRACPIAALAMLLVPAPLVWAAEKTAPWHKSHHLLFNGDCTFLFGDQLVKDLTEKYDKSILHRFIDLLADSGVDTYLCNPSAQVPWYPSKKTPNILSGYRRGDRDFVRHYFRAGLPRERLDPALDEEVRRLNRYLDLAEQGVDWLTEISLACRRRGISPWISIRMNDTHGANSWEKAYLNCALQRDPKYRLSGRQPNPKDGINRMEQALDYSHREVRDYMLTMIREALEDHDFEGLEMDWLRHPFCMDPPATEKQIDTMTRWITEVRRVTQAKAKKVGRPCPLGLRVPVRLGQLRAIGLDLKVLAATGLIDFVNVSNSWQTTWDVPFDELRRDLGPGVALYGVIEDAPNWMDALDPKTGKRGMRLLSASPELLRGNAAGKLALGVTGLETFNFFCTDEFEVEHGHGPLTKKGLANYSALRNLWDLETLRGQAKHYTLATGYGRWQVSVYEYAEQLPAVIEPESRRAFRLSMAAEPASSGLELVVQVVVEKTDTAPDLGVSLNGSWPSYQGKETNRLVLPTGHYTHHVPENRGYNFVLPTSSIREGWNEVLVTNGSHKKGHSVRVVGLDLALRKTR